MPVDSETHVVTSSVSRPVDLVSVFRRCSYIGIGCVHEFIEISVRAYISVNPANNRTFWFNTYMQLGYPKHVSVILDVWYSVCPSSIARSLGRLLSTAAYAAWHGHIRPRRPHLVRLCEGIQPPAGWPAATHVFVRACAPTHMHAQMMGTVLL